MVPIQTSATESLNTSAMLRTCCKIPCANCRAGRTIRKSSSERCLADFALGFAVFLSRSLQVSVVNATSHLSFRAAEIGSVGHVSQRHHAQRLRVGANNKPAWASPGVTRAKSKRLRDPRTIVLSEEQGQPGRACLTLEKRGPVKETPTTTLTLARRKSFQNWTRLVNPAAAQG